MAARQEITQPKVSINIFNFPNRSAAHRSIIAVIVGERSRL
jgi:hypothetical protein